MTLQPPQNRIRSFTEIPEGASYGLLGRPFRSDSSVVSEPPDPWTCSQCSYENGDGRNASCAMCGSKDPSKLERKKRTPWQPVIQESAPVSLTERDRRHSLGARANMAKSINEFGRSISLRLPPSGARPGKEDDDDGDEAAPPSKPLTGRSAYLSHQLFDRSNRSFSFRSDNDDSSVMNSSVSSSVATVASAMTSSADSVMNRSTASSIKTVKASNSGKKPKRKSRHRDATPTRKNSRRVSKTENVRPALRSLPPVGPSLRSSTASSSITTQSSISNSPTSDIYPIDEEQKTSVPPNMRSMSHSSIPPEKTTTPNGIPLYPQTSQDNEPRPTLESKKASDSSQFTASTSAQTSVLSTFNDDDDRCAPEAMERGLPGNQNVTNNPAGDKPPAYHRILWTAFAFCIILLSIILLATLLPQDSEANLVKPSPVSPTLAPTPPTAVGAEDDIALDGSPTLSPSIDLSTMSPSASPSSSSSGMDSMGKMQGGNENDRIGQAVSMGGASGSLVAFVGNGNAGVAGFDPVDKTWSTVQFLNTLIPVPKSAQISMSTEVNRLALGYKGKLEIHEYSPSLGKWIRSHVIGEGIESNNTMTAVSMSGDGMSVAFVPPSLGVQVLRYNEERQNWDFFPMVTDIASDIQQLELSHDGSMLVVLTEDGIDAKTLDTVSNRTWVNYGSPITDIKRATAISLSGDGRTLAVTSRTRTVLYSFVDNVDMIVQLFIINQGGVDISLNYSGDFLAFGSSNQMDESTELFSSISLFQAGFDPETSKVYYKFVDEKKLLGDSLGASLSLLSRESNLEEHTFLAVGAPLDGRKMEGSLRFYLVRKLVQ
eukprot:scaffold1184_cov132-Cylindrotheca_fusiformis.AAC.103